MAMFEKKVIPENAVTVGIPDHSGQDRKRERAAIEGDHSSAQNKDDAIKRLARFLTGINNEILKPLFLVILVGLTLFFLAFVFSKIEDYQISIISWLVSLIFGIAEIFPSIFLK